MIPTTPIARWALRLFRTAALWSTLFCGCSSQRNFDYFAQDASWLSIAPDTIVADGNTRAILTLLLKATDTEAASGLAVSIVAHANGLAIVQDSPTTDSMGLLTAQVTAHAPGTFELSPVVTSRGKSMQLPLTTQLTAVFPPKPAVRFVLSGYAQQRVAGEVGVLTITARDASNKVATSYRGNVLLTSSDSNAMLTSTLPFTATQSGAINIGVVLTTAGNQWLRAADSASGLSGEQSGIVVDPNGADHFEVVGFPQATVAGAEGHVLVQVQDAYNNPVTSYTGTVHLASSDPNAVLPADTPCAAGPNITLPVALNSAGVQSISAQDTQAATLAGIESNIVVSPNHASVLRMLSVSTATAGQKESLQIVAYDQAGNVATDYNQTVVFSCTDAQAVLPASYTFRASDGGNALVPQGVTWAVSGNQTVTASDGSGLLASAQVTVAAGSPNRIVMLLPTTVTAGTALSPNITVMDPWNNIVTTFAGSMGFSSTDTASTTVVPGAATFVASDQGHRVLSGALTFTTAGNQTLSASTTMPSLVSTATVEVTPAPASKLQVTGPSTVVAGQIFTLRVGVMDNYNNIRTDYTGDVTYTSTDYQGVGLPWTYTFMASEHGVSANTNFFLATAGVRTITATANTPGNPNGNFSTTVQAGPLSRLRFGPLQVVTANANFATGLYGADAYGNLVSTYSGNVQLTSSDPNGFPAQGTPLNVTIPSGGITSVGDLHFQALDWQTLSATDAAQHISGQQIFASHPLMIFTQGQNGNSLSDYSHVGNNAGNPYYSPQGQLFHADSYYRTMAHWNTLPTSNVVADAAFAFDASVNANYMAFPTSIVSDGNTGMFVVDESANRVMHWHTLPLAYQPADSVVGQATFADSAGGCDANRLSRPTDAVVVQNANALIVADCSNARVVVYSPIPFVSGAAATLVLGQPTLRSCPAHFSASAQVLGSFCSNPLGLWTDGVHLAVADPASNRVLIYNDLPHLLQAGLSFAAADVVLGQTSMTSGNGPAAVGGNTLSSPVGVTSDGTQLMVVDAGANRILVYGTMPTSNMPTADVVLGQPDFTSSATASTSTGLAGPLSAIIAGKQLYVGDHGNSRYQIYFGQ